MIISIPRCSYEFEAQGNIWQLLLARSIMKSMSKTIQKQEEEIREEKRKYTVLSPKNLSCESPLIWNILKHVLTSFVLFWRCGGKGGDVWRLGG